MREDNMSAGFAVRRMLTTQEVLARYRVGDPGVTELEAAIASVALKYNSMKLGYFL